MRAEGTCDGRPLSPNVQNDELGAIALASDITSLMTENRNVRSGKLDCLSALEIVTLMNQEDAQVALAVRPALPQIADAVARTAESLRAGGRLIYVGAGTSGRLGVLDASECPPTFGVSEDQVTGLLAGGLNVFATAKEAIEDDLLQGEEDVRQLGVNARDFLVGVSASGRTPYTIGALQEARAAGAGTCAVSCNMDAEMSKVADIAVEVDTGAEILTGSTRLKAGTAQKMVLNMISTGAMVLIGKVYDNLMVDLRPTNRKLVVRSVNMLQQVLDIPEETAAGLLGQAEFNVKAAIVMGLLGVGLPEALARLEQAGGFVRRALGGDCPS